MMGAVTEMHIERSVAETVANTYLGPEVGQRVLNGAIRRGEGEEIRAVLWFSDLRDFTGMNERLPAGEVLELLNNYLQLVGDALASNGGEILKFIGDGVMAYFPAEDALFLPMVTGQALAAARRLIGDIEAANEARAAGGRDPLRFGIGLHVGDVTFGNVGTEDRLDFTVIGPAVNRASRLEGLTKELGVPVLRLGRVQRSLHGADEVARQAPAARCPRAGRDLHAAGLRSCQTRTFQPSTQPSASSSGSGWLEASTSSRSPSRRAPQSSSTLSTFLPPPQNVSW